MTNPTPVKTHTPLRLNAGDETRIMDNKGFPLIDVPCGGMTGRRVAEAEELAALIVRAVNNHDDLIALAHQYASDLRHPPSAESVERRLERIAAVLAKVGDV